MILKDLIEEVYFKAMGNKTNTEQSNNQQFDFEPSGDENSDEESSDEISDSLRK